MAASLQAPATFNDRVRALTEAPPIAVYDTLMRDRVRLVALSDDPDICAHLNAGAGVAQSSTVFALMAGAATESYAVGATLKDVISAAMGFSPSGPVATVTAQMLDGSCRLVKPQGASDTREVATTGRVTFHKDAQGTTRGGALDIMLHDETVPLHGDYAATPCPGLLTSIVGLIPVAQAEEEQATALKCLGVTP